MAPFKIPKKRGSGKTCNPLAVSPLSFKAKQTSEVKIPLSTLEDDRIKKARTEMIARAPEQYRDKKMEEKKRRTEEMEERKRVLIKSKENAMKKFRERKEKEEAENMRRHQKAKEEAQLQRKKLAEEAQEKTQWREACERDMEDLLQVNLEGDEMDDLIASMEGTPRKNEMSELLAAVEKLSTISIEEDVPAPTLTNVQQEPEVSDVPILFHTMTLGTSKTVVTDIPAEQGKPKKIRCFKCRGRNHLASECTNARWKDLKKVQKATGVSMFKKTLSKKVIKMVPPPPQLEEILLELGL